MVKRDTIQIKAFVDSKHISFLHWIIESYDGIAIMSTLDSKKGLVEFHVSPDLTETFEELITSLDFSVKMLS